MSHSTPTPFYPILPDAAWIARLVPLGIRTVQLRTKLPDPAAVAREIAAALAVCRRHDCLLVVNDHWQAAIDAGAPAVHLGQEDLAKADLPAIRRHGLALGLSTHDEAELEIALAAAPQSIALGPIFATATKHTGRSPQGIARIGDWRRRLGTRPLTVIGGITLERAPDLLTAGADSVAVVSDVTAATDPAARVQSWLAWERSQTRRWPAP
jgi:thiamine-phosphate pyrophosphorylase